MNIALGAYAEVSTMDLSNATVIGCNVNVDASNKVHVLTATSVTSIGLSQVTWTSFSDGRVKKDIKENVPGLIFIKALRPVTYHLTLQKNMR